MAKAKSKHHAMAHKHLEAARKHGEKSAEHHEKAKMAMDKVGSAGEELKMARKGDYKGNAAKKTNKAV